MRARSGCVGFNRISRARSCARAASNCCAAGTAGSSSRRPRLCRAWRRTSDRWKRLRFGDQPVDHLPAILVLRNRLGQRLQLHLDVLDRLHVAVQLRGQLAGVLLPVGFEPFLLLDQAVSRLLQLGFEELIRALGQRRTVALAFVDEQRAEAFSDLLDRPWIAAAVADAKRRGRTLPLTGAGRLDADVLHPHAFDHVFHQLRLAFLGIEVELADDLFEPRAAQDLLVEGGQAVLEPHFHRWLHVVLGNLLRDHHDERLGAKPVRQPPCHHDGRHRNDDERHQDQPLCAATARRARLQGYSAFQESCSHLVRGSQRFRPTRTPLRLNSGGRPAGRSTTWVKS